MSTSPGRWSTALYKHGLRWDSSVPLICVYAWVLKWELQDFVAMSTSSSFASFYTASEMSLCGRTTQSEDKRTSFCTHTFFIFFLQKYCVCHKID